MDRGSRGGDGISLHGLVSRDCAGAWALKYLFIRV